MLSPLRHFSRHAGHTPATPAIFAAITPLLADIFEARDTPLFSIFRCHFR
jgi:hypothetical protein